MQKKAILLVVIVLVVAGGLFLFFQKKQASRIQKQEVPLDQSVQMPENSIDTSDWKIYRNEEYGFEVKYPNEWSIDDNRSSQNTIVLNTGIDESRESITFLKNTEKISASEWFESNRQKHKGTILNESRLIIDGVDSIKLETGEFAQSFIVFSNEKNLFVVTTMGLIEKKKVLETLRFL